MKIKKRTVTGFFTIAFFVLLTFYVLSARTYAVGFDDLASLGLTIDVTVTDRVYFDVPEDSNDATISNIRVANNANSSVPIIVSGIQATAESGYTLDAFDTNFNSFNVDSKHLGIAYASNGGSNIDIGNNTSSLNEKIQTGSQKDFSFTGKTSAFSSAILETDNTHAMNIVLTIDIDDSDLPTLYNAIAAQTNGVDTNIDFGVISSSTNGNGVNTISSTADERYPVYYYRGPVTNNNVYFNNFCWQIVRTTSTGGVKLVYNGILYNNSCTGRTPYISSPGATSAFNTKGIDSLSYNGYMYGQEYVLATTPAAVRANGNIYANDVQWDGTQYELIDTYQFSNGWNNNYHTITGGYHYTCGSASTSCETVYYLGRSTAGASYAITLTGGDDIESAKQKMFTNAIDSKVKTFIDSWYESNMIGATSKLEDTVWCNDRSLYSGLFASKDEGDRVNLTANEYYTAYYGAYGRNAIAGAINPSVNCPNKNDSFTVDDTESGNGMLAYPVALLTIDEMTLAGVGFNKAGSFIQNATWTMSPAYFRYDIIRGFYFNGTTIESNEQVSIAHYIRPAISIAPLTLIDGGDGSQANPWTLK